MFTLHPRLKADTILIQKLTVSSLYLLNDSRYPWVVIVPERDALTELHDLTPADYTAVMEEVRHLSRVLFDCFNPKKINVGALGNLVPQLHIHIIARQIEDHAWPGPVWGVGEAIPYTQKSCEQCISEIRQKLEMK
ncbi:MAG: HIT domain-containing protein, partial [Sneathiella sp.]|nr:HIT domain-containing protein [Sneathiella sp.]